MPVVTDWFPLISKSFEGVAVSAILLFIVCGAGLGIFRATRWIAENLVKPISHNINVWFEKTNETLRKTDDMLDTVQREAERQTEVLQVSHTVSQEHTQRISEIMAELQRSNGQAVGRFADAIDLLVEMADMIEKIAVAQHIDVHQQVDEIKRIAKHYPPIPRVPV